MVEKIKYILYELLFQKTYSQKEITSQTDKYLVSLSSKTYVFENKLSIGQYDCLFFSVYVHKEHTLSQVTNA